MGIELNNKTVVLTGATSGIGLATAEELCRRGAWLIGVGRAPENCEKIQNDLLKRFPYTKVRYIAADLSSLKNIRRLSEDIDAVLSEWGQKQLDVLINNAGTFTSWFMSSAEGFEMQLAVNHLAPFLLTHLLMPRLKNAPDGRVITVSSGSHYHTRMHWKDLSLRKHYNCLLAYKQSKLANVLFSYELKRKSGLSVFAADPGLVNTEMGLKHTSGLARLVWSIRKNSGERPCDAAFGIVYLAGEKMLRGSRDVYYKACKPKKPNPNATKDENAKRLWQMSETMCGLRSEYYGL
ncbi:MAG: SDR family NAD(P)-dependent oxidoreductase [Clostridia bacterium]|nr:SDR family NAD(P)-dependent oxidoreductase [Clostridia bacterium]